MKIQCQNIYFKNTSPPPHPRRLNGGPFTVVCVCPGCYRDSYVLIQSDRPMPWWLSQTRHTYVHWRMRGYHGGKVPWQQSIPRVTSCHITLGDVVLVYSHCINLRLYNQPEQWEFQGNKMFLLRSLVNIQYCGNPLRPRGSVLSLRQPGLEFRILYLECSVISSISPCSRGSSGPV